ncbi:MAG: NADH-quinone oxidoreductase subunit NuoH [Robiginitomaculum sp.]|nr:MAG: NADH-quinone oxidoreductase subunit NuoH [Robiginitomaculum sp.]
MEFLFDTSTMLGWFVVKTLIILAYVVVLLVSLAFILLADRKIWAAVQMRRGPNVVGAFGLLQSFADFLKFAFKEAIIPAGVDKPVFILAPILTLVMAFITWAVIPVAPGWVIADLNVGILYVLAISSLGVYGIILGGWASNSKYAFLGALRSTAQMISYEVSIGFVLITVLLLSGSLNLSVIVEAQAGGFWHWNGIALSPITLVMFPMMVVFFISALAETNRPPFDLPEAESELVAGYQVEYSSTLYLLFMIGEYLNIVLMCAMVSLLFLGGWHAPFDFAPFTWIPPVLWFVVKICFVFFLFSMVKAIVPRYRYDQLMRLGWKIFLPLSLVAVVAVAGWVTFVQGGA